MASHKPKTRNDSASKLKEYIRSALELNPSEVPTFRAVLQKGLFLRDNNLLDENVAKDYIIRDRWSGTWPLMYCTRGPSPTSCSSLLSSSRKTH
jgi:hypothetical protein